MILDKAHLTCLLITSILIGVNLSEYVPMDNIRIIFFFTLLSVITKHYNRVSNFLLKYFKLKKGK